MIPVRHLVLLVAVVAALQGCATPSQISADAEVRRLCAIDGGIKVYETVRLPSDKFDRDGNFHIPSKNEKSNSEFYYDQELTYLLRDNPTIVKTTYKIIRRSDRKILGVLISYGRGGGDISGPWHPSSFRCPEISRDSPQLEPSIFIKEN